MLKIEKSEKSQDTFENITIEKKVTILSIRFFFRKLPKFYFCFLGDM